jgi:hypothetical protein
MVGLRRLPAPVRSLSKQKLVAAGRISSQKGGICWIGLERSRQVRGQALERLLPVPIHAHYSTLLLWADVHISGLDPSDREKAVRKL